MTTEPLSLSLVSFNYKQTPLALREKLAFPNNRLPSVLRDVRSACGLDELMVVSTCNRVEFYHIGGDPQRASQGILDWLRQAIAGWDDELRECAMVLNDDAALTHLFRVSSSLESMVLGEPQILGQVKDGYRIASQSNAIGPHLDSMMQKAFHAAKRVRTETGIARFPVSVSYVAAELAGRIFETLEDKTVMVIGAGEMAELVIAHLRKAGIHRLLITNRTFSGAVALAEKVQGSVVRYEQMPSQLAHADIVISSTGAQDYIIDLEMARGAARARKGKPMFFIDIAVPRDVDPAAGQLANVYCYDIDDLQSAATENLQEREQEAVKAQRIVENEVAHYIRWKNSANVVPIIKALRQHFTQAGENELEKTLTRMQHLPDRDAAALRRMVQGLINKLLHSPSTRLKEMAEDLNGRLYGEAMREMFGLSLDDPAAPAEAAGGPEGEAAAENVVHLPVTGRSEG